MSKTIVIVEDDELSARLYRDVLKAKGHRTACARTGMTALLLVRQANPNLIIMNIRLPDVSGMEVTRWIKQVRSLKHIPILAVTGLAMEGDKERILGAGCDGYMSKPIFLSEFEAAIQRMLDISINGQAPSAP